MSALENSCPHTMLINHKQISATKIIYALLHVMLSRIILIVLVRCKLICLMLYTGIATWSTQVSEDNYHEEYMAFIKFKLRL